MENQNKIEVSKWPVRIVALIVAVLTVVLVIYRFPGEIESIAEDSFYQRPSGIPYNVKIIAIDETTLSDLGPYSDWDRVYFANLINTLNESEEVHPKVIAVDIMFTGTNNSESDAMLVDACSYGNVILASKYETSSKVEKIDGKYVHYEYVSSETAPFDALSAVSSYGFTNAILDDDGYIRHAYTTRISDNVQYKSFAYQIAERAIECMDEYSNCKIDNLPSIIEFKYTGNPNDFEVIPMSKVLDGSIPASYLDDSIVFVGAYEEGMLDSYSAAVDHSSIMYGVELQVNIMLAILEGKIIHTVPVWIQVVLSFAIIILYCFIFSKTQIKVNVTALVLFILGYVASTFLLFEVTSYKLNILYIPTGLVISFFAMMITRYIELQKKRAKEMQLTLFSMADSMAQAIEGRTPYNANHTINVAKRSVEMLEYINEMHKQKRTEMFFSEQDKNQLYLAAMLHDVGKMDVPLEVMDKQSKLGDKENPLKDRLSIIMLKLRIDALTGKTDEESANKEIEKIQYFLGKLGLFNCGKPLSDEEFAVIDDMAASVYTNEDGSTIEYLTREEYNDLHIKAGTLSDEERTIMQSHVVHTDKILSHVYFGSDYKDVRKMASNHHELLNGKGYPNGIGADQIDTMTRILTIMDIYDSLIADDRPYKKAKPIPIAFKILDEEAEFGKVDKELLAIAKEIYFKEEPKEDKKEDRPEEKKEEKKA